MDDISRAYECTAATSPQAGMMPSARVYELATACLVWKMSTGNMKLNSSMTREFGIPYDTCACLSTLLHMMRRKNLPETEKTGKKRGGSGVTPGGTSLLFERFLGKGVNIRVPMPLTVRQHAEAP